jgi:phosphoribosylglycinamide formyltransferase-1
MISMAILASGRGSNFTAIADAIEAGHLDARVTKVISDRSDAAVLTKARNRGLSSCAVPWQSTAVDGESPVERRSRHEKLILDVLSDDFPQFLIMAGYMRIVTPTLINAFRSQKGYSRIVNVHPSLLPSFPGKEAYTQAFNYGAKQTGVTIHLVDEEMDSGPICAQKAFDISDCRSAEEVEERGLAVEHSLYPETLRWILPERFKIVSRGMGTDRRSCVSQS